MFTLGDTTIISLLKFLYKAHLCKLERTQPSLLLGDQARPYERNIFICNNSDIVFNFQFSLGGQGVSIFVSLAQGSVTFDLIHFTKGLVHYMQLLFSFFFQAWSK